MSKSYFQDKFIKCVFGIEKLFSILKNKKLILCKKCIIVIQVALFAHFPTNMKLGLENWGETLLQKTKQRQK